MQAEFNFIEHARTAVERIASGLARLRHRLELGNADMGRQHRLTVEHALARLARRHAVLMQHYERMSNASAEALPASWRDFLWCYDEYLQAVREAKCGLAHEEYWDDLANAAALAPPLPAQTDRAASS